MIIGIPKETKEQECRVALTPEHVSILCRAGHSVYLEKGAGEGCMFSDEEYASAGAVVRDSVYNCQMIVRVKEPPLSTIKEGQIIMGYLHIEKGQNPAPLH